MRETTANQNILNVAVHLYINAFDVCFSSYEENNLVSVF